MAINASVSKGHQRDARKRDLVVLTVIGILLFFLLFLSGQIGVVPFLGACLTFGIVAMTYYVATTENRYRETAAESADDAEWTVLIDGLPLPAMVIDKTSRVLNYNASAEEVLRTDWSVRPRLSGLLGSTELMTLIENMEQAGEKSSAVLEVDRGPTEAWRVHVSQLRGEENLLVLMEDLAPVRRAARARSDFIANASHELRTPLTALSGFIETMRGPARDDKESWGRFLDIMAIESERMNRLISDLLSLSRIEFSEHAVPTDRIDLAEIATKAVSAFEPMAAEKGVELILEAPSAALPVIGNGDELVQVLENLVSNAIKYSAPGDRIVLTSGQSPSLKDAREKSIDCRNGWERRALLMPKVRPGVEEAAVWIRVEDQGDGIDKEHLPRLGERFYRVDQSRGGKITGTGLGLAIVKHIMTHHRGGFGVESGTHEGTAFAIWVPRAPQASATKP